MDKPVSSVDAGILEHMSEGAELLQRALDVLLAEQPVDLPGEVALDRAIAGCTRTDTVPHHVIPWWLSGLTRLHDLVPLCTSCHHDLHEGHRTLRLRDHRLIDDHGWTTTVSAAA